MITGDGGIPRVAHAYPGSRPDATQFAAMVDLLVSRHTALAAALTTDPDNTATTAATTPAASAPTGTRWTPTGSPG